MSKKTVTVCFEVPSDTDITKLMSHLETHASILSANVKEEKTVYVSFTLKKSEGKWRTADRYGTMPEEEKL